MRWPARPLSPEEFAERLRAGDRRQGVLLYRPTCPACRACEAIRIEVEDFTLSRTQRRIWRRGAVLRTTIGRPTVTAEKVALFNRHKRERGLVVGGDLLNADGYERFLVDTCTETFEVCCRLGEALVVVAVADESADAMSAVYCFFDPDYAALSPGVYAIVTLIDLCRRWRRRYLYLGLYTHGCAAMAYKARYLPHERLIDGVWRRFDRA